MAVLVLHGWAADIQLLKQPVPGFVAMNPATAACLLLSGVCLLLHPNRLIVGVTAGIVTAVAAAKLVYLALGAPGGVDQVLFAGSLDEPVAPPNRMAPNTALALMLLGCALLASIVQKRAAPVLSQILAAVVAATALFALIGYALGIAHLYGVVRFIPMALHTALLLVILSIAVFTVHPGRGLMIILRDRGPAGTLARTLLPVAVLVPVVVGVVRLVGQQAGLYGTETGIALQVMANVLVTFVLLLAIIIALYRSDALRRQREVAVALSEEQYRLAEKVAMVGHWRLELPSKRLQWSEQIFHIVGMDPSEGVPAPGKVLELYHPEDRTTARGSLINALKTGQGWDLIVRLIPPDGKLRYARSHGVAQLDESGRTVAVFGVFADVTELEQARQKAEEATAAKASFLANMSHEIRTPLNSIIGFTDVLHKDPNLTPTQRRQLGLVQNAGSLLLTIVNDVLDLAKIEAGKIELQHESFEIETFVDNTVSIVGGAADAKGLETRVWLDPDLAPYYCGDEGRLRQVLLNLLNNAVKFTAKGYVSLEVRRVSMSAASHKLRFSVSDSGIGIPEGKHGRIFQAFSQADQSISREYGGTGLGLGICRKLVELMNGCISFSSSAGAGSTFWFEVDVPVGKKPEVAPHPAECAVELVTARILLVEDLPMNQELACAILSAAGHDVDVAKDGGEAVMAVQEKEYDLLLMDIQMPKVDGITATKMIRQLNGAASKVPILAMTANVIPEQVREYRAVGMNGHVSKPIKAAELHRAIQSVLRGNNSCERRPRPAETAGAPTDQTASESPSFDPCTFDKVAALFPPDRLEWHLDSFKDQLSMMINKRHDQKTLKSVAHKLVSQAGMLGFLHLSEQCRYLEQTCADGEGFEEALAGACSAAEQGLITVGSLRADVRGTVPEAQFRRRRHSVQDRK